ncbi:MAG: hypothetical protein AMK72_01580 [Planctomycetes bacterium SM23_25]|nr:MAG: hypothetical protein AMK72_01580 [Planctomycetes bacterium SM23_25]
MPDSSPPNPTLDEAFVAGIRRLLEEGRREELARRLDNLHPSDVADLLGDFSTDEKVALFSLLEADDAADVLVETDAETREDIIESVQPEKLRTALAQLEPDEAADVIGELEPREAAKALAGLEDRDEIKRLLEYPPDTAGGLMTTEFVVLPANITCREAIDRASGASETTHRNYLYIIDEASRPIGRLPIERLIFSSPDTPVGTVMETDLHAVPTDMDREQVAEVVRRYDLLSVPAVDPATGAVQGIITIDDVLDAADEEAAEDMYRMAGTAARDPLHMSIGRRAIARLPWLLITLAPGFLVGQIMRWLGYDPGGTTALLLFVPVMIEMAGNVSLQSSTVMVRGLAMGDVRLGRAGSVLANEIGVAVLVGLVCGLVSGLVGYVFFGHDIGFAVVVAFSMLCGILSAAVTGTVIPLACNRVGVDPALASGPFVTSLNDITGTLIYLGLGARLLHLFG